MRNPKVEVLGARLRAGDPESWQLVKAAIQSHRGVIRTLCAELGVPERTWYYWQRHLLGLRDLVLSARPGYAEVADGDENAHAQKTEQSRGHAAAAAVSARNVDAEMSDHDTGGA